MDNNPIVELKGWWWKKYFKKHKRQKLLLQAASDWYWVKMGGKELIEEATKELLLYGTVKINSKTLKIEKYGQ